MNNRGAAIAGDWERWQTNGRLKVAINNVVDGATFTAYIHITSNTARIGIY